MSRCVIFVGPSLLASTIRHWLTRADVRPPASYGDVYRATMNGAVTIGIIDGVSDDASPVSHRELLWAAKSGVHLYGAAGIGAIRAAELHRFGMIGVGRIFGWYRDGVVDGDDEILFADAVEGCAYHARPDSLVNVRATLERAVTAWVLSEAEARGLLAIARVQFYRTRTYATLLEHARVQGAVSDETVARFAEWLESSADVRVNQMRIDAEAMIRRIASDRHDARREEPSFEFDATASWDELTRRIATEAAASSKENVQVAVDPALAPRPHALAQLRSEVGDGASSSGQEAPGDAEEPSTEAPAPAPAERRNEDAELFAEIDRTVAQYAQYESHADEELFMALERAAPELAAEIMQECIERALARALAQRQALASEPRETRAASDRFRFEYGLLSDAQTEAWLVDRGISIERFGQWMSDDAKTAKLAGTLRATALREMRRVYEARALAAKREHAVRGRASSR